MGATFKDRYDHESRIQVKGLGKKDFTSDLIVWSGRKGTFFKIGFSPRKQATTIYLMSGFEKNKEVLGRLGKYKVSKSCLYINKLEDVDLTVLKELIQHIYNEMTQKNG